MAKQKDKKKEKSLYPLFYIITGIAAFIVFANSLGNDFVFDDESVVLGDPTITTLSSIPNYFTGAQGFHKVIGRYYRPVISSSYAIDYSIWKYNAFGFHFTNVLIHIINSLLFLKLLLLIFNPSLNNNHMAKQFNFYAVLVGALIFAVHPIHTEAVAWVSGRTDSLSCTFFFAAFIYYIKYSENPAIKNIVLLLLFYMLALLAKEMAITLPVVIILFDFIYNRFDFKKMLNEKRIVYLLLILLSFMYMLLRWAVLKDVPERITYNYFYGKDFAVTAFTMLQTIPLYFRLTIAPYDMLYHYSGYMPYRESLLQIPVIFSIVFIFIVSGAAVSLIKKIPALSFSLLFFFITLIPVLNIIPTMNFMADRFLYIPSVMVSLAFISLAYKYYSENRTGTIYSAAAVIILVYTYMTVMRNADWKNNDTLFLSAENRPGTVTNVNIGNIYANKKQYDIAETYYRRAIDIRKETVLANSNLGKIFLIKQNYDSAYYYMHEAYLLDTLSPEPMHALAQLNASFEKFPEAIFWLEKIQKVTPGYMNSDKMLTELKNKQQVQQMPKLDLENSKKAAILEQSSYKNYQDKNFTKAIEELTELVKINPAGAPGYYNNRGMCYIELGNYKDAIKSFELSLEGNPDFSTAYNNLGDCYDKMGDKEKARAYYKKALELDPNNNAAKMNLERLK